MRLLWVVLLFLRVVLENISFLGGYSSWKISAAHLSIFFDIYAAAEEDYEHLDVAEAHWADSMRGFGCFEKKEAFCCFCWALKVIE